MGEHLIKKNYLTFLRTLYGIFNLVYFQAPLLGSTVALEKSRLTTTVVVKKTITTAIASQPTEGQTHKVTENYGPYTGFGGDWVCSRKTNPIL